VLVTGMDILIIAFNLILLITADMVIKESFIYLYNST